MFDPLALVPDEQLQAWEDDLVIAEEMAAAHQVVEGLWCLDAGLVVVEAMPPAAWQPQLVTLYCASIQLFQETHGSAERQPLFSGPIDPPGD